MMKQFYCSIAIVFLLTFGTKSNALSFKESNIRVEKEDSISYSKEDVQEAYRAFNEYIYDPDRKLYYRDSDRPEAVAAIWTQAVYWDMAMNAYKLDPTVENRQRIEDIYQGNYDHYKAYDWYGFPDVWFIYDDIMWWVISMARAYELTGESKYLEHAVSGFTRVWYGIPELDVGSYDKEKGGMFWAWTKGRSGKMACINYPTVIAATLLYNITENKNYLDKAKDVYSWSRNNLFDQETGEVADSKHGDGEPNWKPHTYNQGTCIGAAVELYKITEDDDYLFDDILAADFTRDSMSSSSQVLHFDKGEEQGIYHAIFGQYIAQLAKDCDRPEYLDCIRKNISIGWKNRDKVRGLTTRDFSKKVSAKETISAYDASGIVGLMLVSASEK